MLNRINNIDIFKSTGILFVIIAHLQIGGVKLINYAAAFHMPMFFFISGYLFHNYNFKEFVIKKFNSLIIPYFIYSVFNLVVCLACFNNFDVLLYLKQIFWINNDPPIPITGALWFLTSLFFLNIIFRIFYYIGNKVYLGILIVGLVSVIYIFQIKLPFSIDSAIYMLPVYYIGFLFRKIETKINYKYASILSFILFFIIYLLIEYNGTVNIRMNVYSNIFLFYLNALMMSFILFYFSKVFSKIKLCNVISYIGVNSLQFMCIHQSIQWILQVNYHIDNRFILFVSEIMFISGWLELKRIILYKYNKIKASK